METPLVVIKSGGRQYLVGSGSEVLLEKITCPAGKKIDFKEVLLWVDKQGQVQVGKPFLDGVRVRGEVVEQTRGPKLQGISYYNRRHMKKYGHRQRLTRVRIVKLGSDG